MQKTQNNLTIKSLVAKYRNYVAEHCPKACDNGFLTPIDNEADEQLLIKLYAAVTGDGAEPQILDALTEYADKYHKEALTKAEFAFLCENFTDVVSYEFSHRNEWLNGSHAKHFNGGISKERIRLVKDYAKPKKGARVFIADAEYCDLAVMFPDCVIYGFTGMNYEQQVVWALGQIRLFAAGIKSEVVCGEEIDEKYTYSLPTNGSMDVVILRANENKYFNQRIFGTECNDIVALYDLLKPGGRMLFFSEFMEEMAGEGDDVFHSDEIMSFRNQIVFDMAISSVVEYEDKSILGQNIDSYLLLIVEKKDNTIVLFKNERTSETFSVNAETISREILWPSFYSTKLPKTGIPLSELVTFVALKEHEMIKDDGGWVLSEKVKQKPVVTPAKMANEYKDANLLSQDLNLAESIAFDDNLKYRIRSIKERCVLLYGHKNKTVVGYISELPETGIATLSAIVCIVPKDGIDVRYIAALLFDPEVRDQIVSICEGEINVSTFPLIMDKVIVPNHTDKEKLAFLCEINYEALQASQLEMKQEQKNYTKAIRMRKHALTQSLSSIEAMFFALNEFRIRHNGSLADENVISRVKGTTVREAFEFISQNLKDMMPAMEHIASVDYSFEKPEWIDPELFIEDYIKKNESGWLNFKPIMMWEHGHNQATKDIQDPFSGNIILSKGNSICQFLFPKDALERVFKNIISNAKAHGFDNKTRKDYQLRFSWHMDGMALVVIIENNGSPIPNERDTRSLLEYGVSTALHHDGHNGIGCNEIDDIMQRYDGKVVIVSSPEDEFTVKYILTFNHSNTVRSL